MYIRGVISINNGMAYQEDFVSSEPDIILFDQLQYIEHSLKRRLSSLEKKLDKHDNPLDRSAYEQTKSLIGSLPEFRDIQLDENFGISIRPPKLIGW